VLKSIRSSSDLQIYLTQKGLSWSECQLPDSTAVGYFPLRIPLYYADLINWKDPADPLRRMVIPDVAEQHVQPYELVDPIGDKAREAVPGLIHRYPDRCLLLLTTYCAVHCRFCFRREVVGKVRAVDFESIVQYLKEHQEVKEIILSGGDPFSFPVGFLKSLSEYLTPLDHIRTWRFHTRIPAVDPSSVKGEWLTELAVMGVSKRLIIVLHVDHPTEVTLEFIDLIKQLHSIGCVLLSQTVLLKGVNDSAEVLGKLFRSLIEAGVKPYYLHHLDQVVGTDHFRISIDAGKRIYTSLRGNISGICNPEYVLDLPGGFGKVPVMWMKKIRDRVYSTTTFDGQTLEYVDQASEAN